MNQLRTVFIVTFVLAAGAWGATDEPLPRRGFLGAALDAAAGDAGIVVREVFPSTPAAAAGLRSDDVLTQLSGSPIVGATRLADTVNTIGRAREGDALAATVRRDGAETQLSIRIAALPQETNPEFDTQYDAVDVGEWRQRVILTMPRGDGPHPAVVFLQGVSCGTVESPLQPDDRIRQLASEWTRAGFAVLRVEKPGVGDSEGPPCAEIGFHAELPGYEAAVKWILMQPGIDPQRVFLFGHSMGGAFAPLIARGLPVRGIMVYGTIGAPLTQYFHENDARQLPMHGLSGVALEREMEKADRFIELFFGERLSPGQIEERAPELRGFMRLRDADATHVFGRHYTFWHELDDIGLPAPWTGVTAPVLAIWGTADYPASRGDHPLIVETVNAAGKTTAGFVEMQRIGHGFDVAADMQDSMKNRMMGPFDRAIVDVTAAWMREIGAS